jgi:hypothetical protein
LGTETLSSSSVTFLIMMDQGSPSQLPTVAPLIDEGLVQKVAHLARSHKRINRKAVIGFLGPESRLYVFLLGPDNGAAPSLVQSLKKRKLPRA